MDNLNYFIEQETPVFDFLTEDFSHESELYAIDLKWLQSTVLYQKAENLLWGDGNLADYFNIMDNVKNEI